MQASVQNRLRPQLSKENSGLNAAKGQVSGAAAPRNVLANITNIKSAQTGKENLKQQAQQGKLGTHHQLCWPRFPFLAPPNLVGLFEVIFT